MSGILCRRCQKVIFYHPCYICKTKIGKIGKTNRITIDGARTLYFHGDCYRIFFNSTLRRAVKEYKLNAPKFKFIFKKYKEFK